MNYRNRVWITEHPKMGVRKKADVGHMLLNEFLWVVNSKGYITTLKVNLIGENFSNTHIYTS